jgi:Tfp pilus assembly protein PilF
MNRAACILMVLLAAWAAPVCASDDSERLAARGLVSFHREQYAQALEAFERAVAADPGDVQARYYRGVTRARLGNAAGAREDLAHVVAQQPDFTRAALDLGILLVDAGEYAEALTWLDRARPSPELAAPAAFHAGIAHLRLGDAARARADLEQAADLDPALAPPAHYYLGVADYAAGDLDRARQHFERVVAASPDSAIGREAQAFLQRAGKARQPYRLGAEVGLQYDSNVVLAPADDVLKDQNNISDQSDGRVTVALDGAYVPWQSERARVSVGYAFFQSLHFEIDEFNLQDHRPGLDFALDAGLFQTGVAAHYDYFFLQDDSFLQRGTVLPWLSVPTGRLGHTDLYYQMERTDFLKRPYSGLRDAFNHAAGVRQVIPVGGEAGALWGGYRFDHEDPISDDTDAQAYAYDGHQVELGAQWALPASVGLEASYAYRQESYDDRASGNRKDKEHLVIVALRRALSESVEVIAGYLGNVNNSNDENFEYDRHIGSVALGVRY